MNPNIHLILEIVFIVFFLLYFAAGAAWRTSPEWPARSGYFLAILIGILGIVEFARP